LTTSGNSPDPTFDGTATTQTANQRNFRPQQKSETCNEGRIFEYFKSFYVDDAAFIIMRKEELQEASALICRHFKKFGLTVHWCGNRRRN
jgi:hypothetical protein